jgi:hypothetical protein
MYISIHLNASPSPSWRGLQVFYTGNNKENKIIAETITNHLKENISNVREIKKDNTYYMYKHIKSPGVLIEAGFISNPNDNYLLRDVNYQNKLSLLSLMGPLLAPSSLPPCPASKIITFPSKFKFFTVAVTLGKHNVTRKKHIIISSLYLFILHLLKYMLFIYSK